MTTQNIPLTSDVWTDVTAVASLVLDQNYSLQNTGNTGLYLSAAPTPPAINTEGIILSVGQQDYLFNQTSDKLYARVIGSTTSSPSSSELTLTENNTLLDSASVVTPTGSFVVGNLIQADNTNGTVVSDSGVEAAITLTQNDVIDQPFDSSIDLPVSANQVRIINTKLEQIQGDLLEANTTAVQVTTIGIFKNFGLVSIGWDANNDQPFFFFNSIGITDVNASSSVFEQTVAYAPQGGTFGFVPAPATQYYFSSDGLAKAASEMPSGGIRAISTVSFRFSGRLYILNLNTQTSYATAASPDLVIVNSTYTSSIVIPTVQIPVEASGNLTNGSLDFSFGSAANTTGTGLPLPFNGNIIGFSTTYTSATPATTVTGVVHILLNGAEQTSNPITFGAGAIRTSNSLFSTTPIPVSKLSELNFISKVTTLEYVTANIYLTVQLD